jgi:hypothetical protein
MGVLAAALLGHARGPYEFVPISEEEASRIVERIRELADPGE